jgi:hypothetical protein
MARGSVVRLRWRTAFVAVGLVLAILAATGAVIAVRHTYSGQASLIGADNPRDISQPWPTPQRPSAKPGQPSYIWAVSPNGRYFVDQYGSPALVRGDSPWSLMTDLSPEQAESWFANRQKHGFNAIIVSLIGATGNGAPYDDGTTYDGLRPFVNGNILQWQEPYWQRVEEYLLMAADHGMTVMLYPIDGWTIGHSFKPKSVEQCQAYGSRVAKRFSGLPNIIWMSGGDYFPHTNDPSTGSDVDHCIDSMMNGIRTVGDPRPFSIQLGYQKSISTDNPYWAQRVNWNFVYSYYPTYRAVLDAYGHKPVVPALLGEANYEGENAQADTPATSELTLRRQLLWALTSGSPGDVFGTDDWEFHEGWEKRLDSESVVQISALRDLFRRLQWWQLTPDTDEAFVIGGRGSEIIDDHPLDVLQNDYVTAAKTPDGRLAVVYFPASHKIRINRSQLAPNVGAAWVDPTSGQHQRVAMGDIFTSPGVNVTGDTDWLLLFTAPGQLQHGPT